MEARSFIFLGIYLALCCLIGFGLSRVRWWRDHYTWFTWPLFGLSFLLLVKGLQSDDLQGIIGIFYGIATFIAWRCIVHFARRAKRTDRLDPSEGSSAADIEAVMSKLTASESPAKGDSVPEEQVKWKAVLKNSLWFRPILLPGLILMLIVPSFAAVFGLGVFDDGGIVGDLLSSLFIVTLVTAIFYALKELKRQNDYSGDERFVAVFQNPPRLEMRGVPFYKRHSKECWIGQYASLGRVDRSIPLESVTSRELYEYHQVGRVGSSRKDAVVIRTAEGYFRISEKDMDFENWRLVTRNLTLKKGGRSKEDKRREYTIFGIAIIGIIIAIKTFEWLAVDF